MFSACRLHVVVCMLSWHVVWGRLCMYVCVCSFFGYSSGKEREKTGGLDKPHTLKPSSLNFRFWKRPAKVLEKTWNLHSCPGCRWTKKRKPSGSGTTSNVRTAQRAHLQWDYLEEHAAALGKAARKARAKLEQKKNESSGDKAPLVPGAGLLPVPKPSLWKRARRVVVSQSPSAKARSFLSQTQKRPSLWERARAPNKKLGPGPALPIQKARARRATVARATVARTLEKVKLDSWDDQAGPAIEELGEMTEEVPLEKGKDDKQDKGDKEDKGGNSKALEQVNEDEYSYNANTNETESPSCPPPAPPPAKVLEKAEMGKCEEVRKQKSAGGFGKGQGEAAKVLQGCGLDNPQQRLPRSWKSLSILTPAPALLHHPPPVTLNPWGLKVIVDWHNTLVPPSHEQALDLLLGKANVHLLCYCGPVMEEMRSLRQANKLNAGMQTCSMKSGRDGKAAWGVFSGGGADAIFDSNNEVCEDCMFAIRTTKWEPHYGLTNQGHLPTSSRCILGKVYFEGCRARERWGQREGQREGELKLKLPMHFGKAWDTPEGFGKGPVCSKHSSGLWACRALGKAQPTWDWAGFAKSFGKGIA